MASRIERAVWLTFFAALAFLTACTSGAPELWRDQETGIMMCRSGLGYPTGSRSSSALWLETTAPTEVQINRPFTYKLEVTNLTDRRINEVVVVEEFPTAFDVTSSSIQVVKKGGSWQWRLGNLDPHEKRSIDMTIVAFSVGELQSRASLHYESGLDTRVSVVRPDLVLEADLPQTVTVGEVVPLHMVVRNPGSGTAENVRLQYALPEGLVTERGDTGVEVQIGALGAGQWREATVGVRASKPGSFRGKAIAHGANSLLYSTPLLVEAFEPVISLMQTGPANAGINGTCTYEVVLANNGNGTARDTVVESLVPPGFVFVSASEGYTYRGSSIQWEVGDVVPGGNKKLSIVYRPESVGRFDSTFVCHDRLNNHSRSTVNTVVSAAPEVKLIVTGADDPVSVGEHNAYTVRLSNHSDSSCSSIDVSCILGPELEFAALNGKGEARCENGVVSFESVKEISPGSSVEWKVFVRAVKQGQASFKVRAASPNLPRVIESEESTRVNAK